MTAYYFTTLLEFINPNVNIHGRLHGYNKITSTIKVINFVVTSQKSKTLPEKKILAITWNRHYTQTIIKVM